MYKIVEDLNPGSWYRMSSYRMGTIHYWWTDKYQSEVLISLFIVKICIHTIYNQVNLMTHYINMELYILSQRYDNDEIYIYGYTLIYDEINDSCHLLRQ